MFKLPPTTTDPNLSVEEGQVTFSAEGDDYPSSPNFSRKIHWPKSNSGVTLGRGYDMRLRTEEEIYQDLVMAEMPKEEAEKASKAALLHGAKAAQFVSKNKNKIEVISTKVQKQLFEMIYPAYVSTARRIYEKRTHNKPHRVEWNKLSNAVKDVLVDFAYQGFEGWPKTMEWGMNNKPEELIQYIKTSPSTRRYENGRRRVDYLKKYGNK